MPGFSKIKDVINERASQSYKDKLRALYSKEIAEAEARWRPLPSVSGEPHLLNVLRELAPGVFADDEHHVVWHKTPQASELVRRYLERYWTDYVDVTLSDLAPDLVSLYRKALFDGKSLYLYSVATKENPHGTGNGKTRSLIGLFTDLCSQDKDVVLVDYTEMADQLRADNGRDAPVAFQRYIECEVLCIDDFARGKPTEWLSEKVCSLLDLRNRQRKLTYFSSNATLEEAVDALNQPFMVSGMSKLVGTLDGDRVYSRLNQLCVTVRFDGPDRRIR